MRPSKTEPDDAVQGRRVSTFVRFQSPYPGKRGVHTGVFGLINMLGRAGQLSELERRDWQATNDWFTEAVTDPNVVNAAIYDDVINPRATAWFRAEATEVMARLDRHLEILRDHGVPCVRVETGDPGRIIYEDAVQIVVVPHDLDAVASFHA